MVQCFLMIIAVFFRIQSQLFTMTVTFQVLEEPRILRATQAGVSGFVSFEFLGKNYLSVFNYAP